MDTKIMESLHMVQDLYESTKLKLKVVTKLNIEEERSNVNELKRQYRCLIFDLENTDFDIAATRLAIVRKLERIVGICNQ